MGRIVNCGGCGNTKAYRTVMWDDKDEHGKRVTYEQCDRCGETGSVSMSDVFWDGKPEVNLADDPNTGKPRVFASRQEKARYLKEKGLIQVDGRNHGGFGYGQSTTASKDWKPVIREARAKVEQMGKTVRREMIWKMIKKSQAIQGR